PGHGAHSSSDWHAPTRPWILLIILPVAGLIVGWMVQTFAPEAEGHGTDAVIHAVHRERSLIRKRVPAVKLLASILTIGSGGSAGREGPVAQVGAGFGSYLARLLSLSPKDRRLMVIAGVAAGIGGMFRAPLGGALFAIEVLYSENEFESEALIPSIIASIVAYVVNASFTGWGHIFKAPPVTFNHPLELGGYLALGIVLSLVAIVYVKVFYGMRDLVFHPMPVPAWVKPGIGGLLLAILAMGVPQVMGGGYGWLQLTMDHNLPFKLLLLLLPAKILATAFTISSGGSGGVFAPSLIIGGITGAVFAELFSRVAPSMTPPHAACVLVGMGAFFAGAAKVPIASLIMVAEMSGSYNLLVPLMFASSVSFLLTRGVSIYEEQVPGRIDSPAHLGEFQVDVLEQLRVSDVLDPTAEVISVVPGTPFLKVLELASEHGQDVFPVVDTEGRMVSMFSMNDVRRVVATPEVWSVLVADDLGNQARSQVHLDPDDDLHTALRRFMAAQVNVLPVLEGPPPARLLGLLSHHQVMDAYDRAMRRFQAGPEEE
ncbi:MAG TPA: chloride channel protein, partial [Acidobacteria bacterium]|nr:chloride channel protein [Acidobacteriota bacterium]